MAVQGQTTLMQHFLGKLSELLPESLLPKLVFVAWRKMVAQTRSDASSVFSTAEMAFLCVVLRFLSSCVCSVCGSRAYRSRRHNDCEACFAWPHSVRNFAHQMQARSLSRVERFLLSLFVVQTVFELDRERVDTTPTLKRFRRLVRGVSKRWSRVLSEKEEAGWNDHGPEQWLSTSTRRFRQFLFLFAQACLLVLDTTIGFDPPFVSDGPYWVNSEDKFTSAVEMQLRRPLRPSTDFCPLPLTRVKRRRPKIQVSHWNGKPKQHHRDEPPSTTNQTEIVGGHRHGRNNREYTSRDSGPCHGQARPCPPERQNTGKSPASIGRVRTQTVA